MDIQTKAEDVRVWSQSRRGVAPVLRIRVWDPFVRVAHWLVVLLVTALLWSGFSGDQEAHMALGVDVLILILGRFCWGYVGENHARFDSFVTGPRTAIVYLISIVRGHPRRFLGHNPAGGWMVVMLLSTLSVLTVSGLVLQAELEYEGWLVGFLALTDSTVSAVLTVHQLSLWALLSLIPLHLLGVIAASVQHRENLVAAMFSGYKSEIPPSSPKEMQ